MMVGYMAIILLEFKTSCASLNTFIEVQSVFSGDHKIVSTDEACKSLKEKLLNEGIPKLDKVFDSLDVLKNICMARKANEKDQVAELKREVQQKTNYMISILQSREKLMCEQIDIALEENIAKIDSGIQSTEKSMVKVSNFLEICKEWSQMTAENALLQLKPLLEQRLRDVTRDNKVKRMKGLKLDTISWNDTMTETILPLIQRFGDIQISKSSFRCIILFSVE